MELFFYDVLDKKATIFEYKNNNFSEGQPPVVILVPDINIETQKVM